MARGVDYLEIMNRSGGSPPMAAAPAVPSKPSKGRSAMAAYAEPLTGARKVRSTQRKKPGAPKMAKRKQSEKQKRASMRNLAKARSARRALAKAKGGGKKPLTRGQRKTAARRRSKLRHLGAGHAKHAKMQKRSKRARKMQRAPSPPRALRPSQKPRKAAKRRKARAVGGRRAKGRTMKQHRAAMRNLAKARRARKSARSRHTVKAHKYRVKRKAVRVAGHMSWETRGKRKAKRSKGKRRHKQTAAQRRASLKNLGKARRRGGHAKEMRRGKSHRKVARRRGRSSGYELYEKKPKRRKGKRRQTVKQRKASLRNLRKARAARKSAKSRHKVRGYKYTRKGGIRRVSRHLSWERAMENPLSGLDLFLTGLSGLVWFGATDFADRIVATHALTNLGTKDAAGNVLYADNPPTSGDYVGLFNATAITAPMNAWRWLAGAGMVIVPGGLSWVIGPEHPSWKMVFQGAAVGGSMRILGKALIDLMARITMWTSLGEQLYDGEMRAQILTGTDLAPLASLPYAASPTTPGVSGAPCGACTQCKSGVGACADKGVGWPSMPRENLPPGATATPPPPPPPGGGSSTTTTTPTQTTPLEGAPQKHTIAANPLPALPLPRQNPFSWGEKEEAHERAA